jgi:hypothetical protein
VFSVPIPTFSPDEPDHQLLAQLGERAEQVASEADIGSGAFQSKRKHVHARLFRDRLALSIERPSSVSCQSRWSAPDRVRPSPIRRDL